MGKPFTLFPHKKKNRPAKEVQVRPEMPMKYQSKQCEWLSEPSNYCPEQALGIAVLQRAVLDLITPGVKEHDQHNASMWITSQLGDDFERDYALSFSRIVEGFTEMPVHEFRMKLLSWVEEAKLSKDNANGFRFQRG